MLPIIWPGDVLNIEGAKGGLAPGDIVLIARDDRFFVHRLIRFSQTTQQWTARGDALRQPDPPVIEPQILGRVVTVCRGNRNNVPGSHLSLLHRVVGLSLGYCDRLRNLALRVHRIPEPVFSQVHAEQEAFATGADS